MWNPPYNPNVDANVHDAWQSGYLPVNQAFARQIVEQADKNDRPPVIIGHDYHLYMLPEYLRQEIPDAFIQHFIHIPWPASPLLADDSFLHHAPDLRLLVPGRYPRLPKRTRTAGVFWIQWMSLFGMRRWIVGQIPFGAAPIRHGSRVYPISINVPEVQRIANSPRALEYEEKLRAMCGGVP